jgi:hypothetical protein
MAAIESQSDSGQTKITHMSSSHPPLNQLSHSATKEGPLDPKFDVNLPYRTLSPNANLNEYTSENSSGEISGPLAPDGRKYKLVTFIPDDPTNPKNWSKAYKWYCTMVVAFTCFTVAFASSVISADIVGVQKEFDISEEKALLPITVFVCGFGLGMRFLILLLLSSQ